LAAFFGAAFAFIGAFLAMIHLVLAALLATGIAVVCTQPADVLDIM
jgi:hypothetical protein